MTVLGDVTQLSASEELHLHLSDAAMPGPDPGLGLWVSTQNSTKRSKSRSVEIVEKSILFMYLEEQSCLRAPVR